jgi:RHS repeat-associated protein
VNGVLQKGWLYKDQLYPVVETDAAGNVVAQFVYGACPNCPSYMVKGSQTYAILSDHVGSPRLLVNQATGAIAQVLEYDSFGLQLSNTASEYQPFGFAGGLYDEDTGLVRFGARDYDALVGRWTAKDPIGFSGSPNNMYIYANSNPTNLVDPNGMTWCDVNVAVGIAFQYNPNFQMPSWLMFSEQAESLGYEGMYDPSSDILSLSTRYEGEISSSEAVDLLTTILHELFHIVEPEGPGICENEQYEQWIEGLAQNATNQSFMQYLAARDSICLTP